MALAVDATSTGTTTGTSLTVSHTCTGSNLLLLVGAYTHGTLTDIVTGITYAGTAMTRINTVTNSGGGNTASRLYLYYLINPATGANNVVTSLSESRTVLNANTSYTGAKQSGQPDAGNTAFSATVTTLGVTITSVADNSWLVGTLRGHSGTVTAGTSTSQRIDHATVGLGFYELTANPISPAAAKTINADTTIASDMMWCLATIAPSVATPIIRLSTLLGIGL